MGHRAISLLTTGLLLGLLCPLAYPHDPASPWPAQPGESRGDPPGVSSLGPLGSPGPSWGAQGAFLNLRQSTASAHVRIAAATRHQHTYASQQRHARMMSTIKLNDPQAPQGFQKVFLLWPSAGAGQMAAGEATQPKSQFSFGSIGQFVEEFLVPVSIFETTPPNLPHFLMRNALVNLPQSRLLRRKANFHREVLANSRRSFGPSFDFRNYSAESPTFSQSEMHGPCVCDETTPPESQFSRGSIGQFAEEFWTQFRLYSIIRPHRAQKLLHRCGHKGVAQNAHVRNLGGDMGR